MSLKSLGQNAFLYAIGNMSIRLGSFLLIPFYTYSLSISEYGMLVTLLMTIQVLLPVIGLGTPTGFMRFADKYQKKRQMGSLVGSTIFIQACSGIAVTNICVFLLLPFFRLILHADLVLDLVTLTCLAAVAQSLFDHITSYYRVRSEGIKFITASIFAFVLLLLTNLIFLRILSWGIKGALIAQIITYGVLWILILLHVWWINYLGVSRKIVGRLFKFSFPLAFAVSSGIVGDVSAIYLLSMLASLEQVAIYSLGYKIASIVGNVLILPFQLAYEPFVYQNTETPGIQNTIGKALTYLMLSFSFVAFCIVFIARDLLHVIAPPEYFVAYPIIFWILPAMAFKGVYYIGESLLNIKHRTQFVGIVVTVLTVTGILFNYCFIKLWGMYGAIFVFNIMAIITSITLVVCGNKTFPILLEWSRLIFIAGLTTFFMASVFFLHPTSSVVYYLTSLIIGTGSLFYILFGPFFYPEEKATIKGFIQRIHSN